MAHLIKTVVLGLVVLTSSGRAEESSSPQPSPPKHPNFSGRWKLDSKASDPGAALLKAKGYSGIEIAVARRISVLQVIEHRNDTLAIEVITPIRRHKAKIVINGKPVPTKNFDGSPVDAVSRWSKDGRTIVTTARVKLEQAGWANLTMLRSLSKDGKSMYQNSEHKLSSGSTIRVRRVFRREADQ